jgi:hypothetical protein
MSGNADAVWNDLTHCVGRDCAVTPATGSATWRQGAEESTVAC